MIENKMMKRLLYLLAAPAILLLAASCKYVYDDEEEPATAKTVVATFTVNVPGNFGTRAIGDGATVNRVACALYDISDGTGEQAGSIEYLDLKDKTATWETRIMQGRKYKAVFFAYNKNGDSADSSAYVVTDMTNITLKRFVANDETLDCFSGTADDIYVGNNNTTPKTTVTLQRPVAQVNFGSSDADQQGAKDRGITVAQSQITVSDAYTAFNAYDGAVTGSKSDVTFTYGNVPTDKLTVGNNDTYTYGGFAYVFVEDGTSTVSYNWKTAADTDGKFKSNDPAASFANVPLRANYRTNIVGSILTNPESFTVEVDGDFAGSTVVAYSADDLANAISEGRENITLGADVTYTDDINLGLAKTQNIDLANHTLTTGELVIGKEGSDVTIKGGTLNLIQDIKNDNTGGNGIEVVKASKLTLDGVTLNAINTGLVCGFNEPTDNNSNTVIIRNSKIKTTWGSGIVIQNNANNVTIENSNIEHNWFGITQNGVQPGSTITLTNVNISGPYSGIYLSNNKDGAVNTLVVNGGTIHSKKESAIEVKKTNITVTGATLESDATTQSYSVSGGGSNAIGYGIALVGYVVGTAYEGTTNFSNNNTFNLKAGSSAVTIGKYDGTNLVQWTNK